MKLLFQAIRFPAFHVTPCRESLKWVFSYICCICVHPDLDTAPLFVGSREKSVDIQVKFHHRLIIVIIIINRRDCDACLNFSMIFDTYGGPIG